MSATTPATTLAESAVDNSPGTVRVCLSAVNFHPVYAGPAIRFRRYLAAFAAHGVAASVVAGTPEIVKAEATGIERDWGRWKYGQSLPVTELNGAPLYRIRLPDAGKRRRGRMLARALVDHCRQPETRPDVIQLLSCGPFITPSLLRLRKLHIPVAYTATMLPDLGQLSTLQREWLRRFVTLPMQLLDAVVVSSEVMRERLREQGVRTPVHVIPNGVDTERFRPDEGGLDRARIRRKLGIPENAELALFVGPIVSRKGIDLLLEAWNRLCRERPMLHLVLAGPRMDMTNPRNQAFHREIVRLVDCSGASDRVHFPGMVEDVEAYMRAADLFVFPSRREGMPNVVPEAMACGLPVVMTPFVGLPSEFGDSGRHYLLVGFDAKAIAEAIGKLLERPKLRGDLGAAARARVVRYLDVERSVDRYAELYRHLAHNPNDGKQGQIRGSE